jgi:hypothetical protein
MAPEYFPCLFRLGNADHYVIWSSDDRDGLVRDGGRVVAFPSLGELQAYAVQRELQIQPAEVGKYDWDSIERWCSAPEARAITADAFLNAWNMVVDGLPARGQFDLFSHVAGRNGPLYEKLSRANNLPAMTPPGAEYYPVWTRAEVDALAQVMRLGIAEVRYQLGGEDLRRT